MQAYLCVHLLNPCHRKMMLESLNGPFNFLTLSFSGKKMFIGWQVRIFDIKISCSQKVGVLSCVSLTP